MNFGTTNLLNKAKESVTQYLGITEEPDIIMSPIYTTRDMSSDYFLVKVESFIPKDKISKSISFRIPDSFTLDLKATFSSLVEGKLGIVSTLNKFLQAGAQLTGSKISLNTKFTTSQIWEGSAPVSITLPIELNAVQDVNADVFDKVKTLSSMVLPREGNENNWFDMFLRAPGPTALNLANDPTLKALKDTNSDIYKSIMKQIDSGAEYFIQSGYDKKEVEDGKSTAKNIVNWLSSSVKSLEGNDPGENIDITIGKILTFKRCIITDINWNFDCTRLLNGSGLPMRVSGKMTFKTSTAMTANDFEEALNVESKSPEFDLLGMVDSSLGLKGYLKGLQKSTNTDTFKDLT